MTLFEKIIDETNLLRAWIKVRHYAHTSMPYFDRLAYEQFEDSLIENLKLLRFYLDNGSYEFPPLRFFEIPKGDGLRKVYYGSPDSDVVAQSIINIIGPIFEAGFSDKSFGNRLNIDDLETKAIFRSWSSQYEEYAVNLRSTLHFPTDYWYEISDFSNFYPSINTLVTRSEIARKITDSKTLDLIDKLLSIKEVTDSGALAEIPGIPAGPAYAHFIANIHLNDFDKLVQSKTIAYFRYVDDFCFVCVDEAEARNVEQSIREFFQSRSEKLVRLNEEKTQLQTIGEPDTLLEHTAKMKYDLRFGALDSINSLATSAESQDVQQRAERLFHDLFMRIESDEDPAEIMKKSAGFIASRLPELAVSKQEALNISYGLLTLGPVRISALRAVLGSILEISRVSEEHIARLSEYIESATPLIQTVFLQLIASYDTTSTNLNEIINTVLISSPKDYVRAAAYYVFANSSYRVELSSFRDWIRKETSSFALKYLLNCVRNLKIHESDKVWTELASLRNNQSSEVLSILAFALRRAIEIEAISVQMLELLFAPPTSWAFRDARVGIYSLRLILEYGNEPIIRLGYGLFTTEIDSLLSEIVEPVIISNTIQYLTQKKRYAQLLSVANSLISFEQNTKALTAYQEIVTKSEDDSLVSRAKIQQQLISPTIDFSAFPAWYNFPSYDKGLYRNLSEEPDYLCRYYDDVTTNRRGTLEVINNDRIISHPAFHSLEDWSGYLQTLSSLHLIELADEKCVPERHLYSNFYTIPPGYTTVLEWMANDQYSKSESNTFLLICKIIEAVEKTRLRDVFHFLNLSPCNVLWNATAKQVMFLNIGSGLQIPHYSCGVPGCTGAVHRQELGSGLDCYFIGLLFLQIFSGECPANLVKEDGKLATQRKTERRNGSYLDQLNVLPHVRSIIARLTHKKPEYRYADLKLLGEDSAHVANFLDVLISKTGYKTYSELTQVGLKRLILVDYVSFRLRIIGRNPQIAVPTHIDTHRDSLRQLSRDIEYYNKNDLSIWTEESSWIRNWRNLPPWTTWLWQSTENKHLLLLACGWQTLVADIEKEFGLTYSTEITHLMNLWVLHSELAALVSAILVIHRNESLTTKRCLEFANLIIEAKKQHKKLRIQYFKDFPEFIFPLDYSTSHIKAASEIAALNLRSSHQVIQWERESSMSLVALVALFCFTCEILDEDDHQVASLNGPLHFALSTQRETDLRSIIQQFSEIDNARLNHFKTTDNVDPAAENRSLRQIFIQVLYSLRRLTPVQRVAVGLTRFSIHSSPRSGVVEARLILPTIYHIPFRLLIPGVRKNFEFSEANSLLQGDLYRSVQSTIDADFVAVQNKRRVSALFGEPEIFRGVGVASGKTRDGISGWLNHHKRLVRTLIIAFVLFVVTEVYGMEEFLLLIPWPIIRYPVHFTLWVMVAIIGDEIRDYVLKSTQE